MTESKAPSETVLFNLKEAVENIQTTCQFNKRNETYFTQCGNVLEFNVPKVVPSLREGPHVGVKLMFGF
jgi:hypothetical protein